MLSDEFRLRTLDYGHLMDFHDNWRFPRPMTSHFPHPSTIVINFRMRALIKTLLKPTSSAWPNISISSIQPRSSRRSNKRYFPLRNTPNWSTSETPNAPWYRRPFKVRSKTNYFICFLGLYVVGSSPKALKSNGGSKQQIPYVKT